MIERLALLAREASPEKRSELLLAVANLFASTEGARSYRAVEAFVDIVDRLLDKIAADGRAALSERLAPCEGTPRPIAERLARDDDLAVAGPMLRRSPALTDTVLVDIASTMSQGHLDAIARRDRISARVTDVLLEHGDRSVLRTVIGNDGASFSKDGFEKLAEKAASDREIAERLFHRTDLPADAADRFFSGLNGDIKERLWALAATDASLAANLVGQAVSLARECAEANEARPSLDARAIAIAVRAGDMSIDRAVEDLVGQGRMNDVAFVLSKVSEFPVDEVHGAMAKADLTGLAVICRGVGVSRATFGHFARAMVKRLSLPNSHAAHFEQTYDAIDRATVDRITRFLSVRRTALKSASVG